MIFTCRTAAFLAFMTAEVDALSVHSMKYHVDSEEGRELAQRVGTDGAFVDVTPVAFPEEWYSWNHSGFPRSHQGTPTFVDFNKDGLLDYFYHNHYQGNPKTDWDMGIAEKAITSFGSKLEGPFYTSVGSKSFIHTEPDDSKWKTPEQAMDTHGTAILDIDRDGILDIYIATGGGDGMVGGPCKNAVMMWGERDPDAARPIKFTGGRDAAELAGLENKDSRGRMNYFADINGDGLLDVIFLNEPRADPTHAPGYAMINKGDRTFEPHFEMSEYTETMVLTDADGDGKAEEFVVPRRDCAIKQCYYSGDNTCKKLKGINQAWYDFCQTHPEGSLAIYKFDHQSQKLEMISDPVKPTKKFGDKGKHVLSVQTGDWDGDGKADLAMLMPDSIDFYYSSDRKQGQLPSKISDQVTWNVKDCDGGALRAADLDNDGAQELLVLCSTEDPKKGPAHRLYSRWGDTKSWKMESQSWLGSIVDESLVHPTDGQLKKLCEDKDSTRKGYLHKMCDEFHGIYVAGGHLKKARAMGLSVVDFNNDGYLDVSIAYDTGKLLMLQNAFQHKHKFIAVRLMGRDSNDYGIGSTVVLKAKGIKYEGGTQLREVYSASHETDWLGTKDDRMIFGLGEDGVPESIEVRWPGKNGATQIIDDVDMLANHMNTMSNPLVILEPKQ